MLAALLTVAAATGEVESSCSTSTATKSGGDTVKQGGHRTAPQSTVPLPGTAPKHHSPSGNDTHRRSISSVADMRFLHVPRKMADALIPDIAAFEVARSGCANRNMNPGDNSRPIFISQLLLIDMDGRAWPVLFRTYFNGKQYHRRLTVGWGRFAAAHGLHTGDAVLFWRQAGDEREGGLVLRVCIVRGAD